MMSDYSRYIGKYCTIDWDGGGMTGWVSKIEDGWLFVDFGYGISVRLITRIRETTPQDSAAGARLDPGFKLQP